MVAVRRQRGAAYLSLLVAVAVVSAILANTAEIVSRTLQRDRERHLLWVGEQIRLALVSYSRTPAGVDTFPKALADLVEDRRKTVVQRHLRRVYFDPVTGSEEWGLILNPQGRIIGVSSNSKLKPIRSTGFATHYAHFAKAKTYGDWRFGVGNLLLPEDADPKPPEPLPEEPIVGSPPEDAAPPGELPEARQAIAPPAGKGAAVPRKGAGTGAVVAGRPGSGSGRADGTSSPPTSGGGGTPIRPPAAVRPPAPPEAPPEVPPEDTSPADTPVDPGGDGTVDAPVVGE